MLSFSRLSNSSLENVFTGGEAQAANVMTTRAIQLIDFRILD